MQCGREETLEERYVIKFCFRLGKNATEMYGIIPTAFRPSCMNQASVFECHKRFKEGRESMRDDERCGRSNKVNTPALIGQRVRVRVTVLRFKRSSARDSVGRGQNSSSRVSSFPRGKCTSPQLHPYHRLFDQDGHQHSSLSHL